MEVMPAFLSQFGNFTERFEWSGVEFGGLGWIRGKVCERRTGHGFQAQILLAPSHEGENLERQWERLQKLHHPGIQSPLEWWRESKFSALLSADRSGEFFSRRKETFRDEIYLAWLKQALEILAFLHSQGLEHLAQGETSWLLVRKEGAFGESLQLRDLGFIPRHPLAGRVLPSDLIAVAPEILRGESYDARADLYSMACLILRQRSGRLFERFDTVPKILQLHRGGRIADLVPKTPSPLNQLLRKMLQLVPEQRPSSARAILQETFDASPKIPSGDSSWNERRQERQATLIFSSLWTLFQDNESEMAEAWMQELPEEFLAQYKTYHNYLELYSDRHTAPTSIGAVDIPTLNEVPDPELRVLFLLEGAAFEQSKGRPEETEKKLDQAQSLAQAIPQGGLQARTLLKRARFFREVGRGEAALQAIQEAYRASRGLESGRLMIGILAELGDAWMQQDPRRARGVWRSSLAMAKAFAQESGPLHLGAAIAACLDQDFAEAARHFDDAKNFYGARKDVEGLIPVLVQEIRFFLESKDWVKARRELKVLRTRVKDRAPTLRFLDWLEISLWLTSGEYIELDPEAFLSRELPLAENQLFHELGWAPQESLSILSRALRRLGRDAEADQFHERAAELAQRMREALRDIEVLEPTRREETQSDLGGETPPSAAAREPTLVESARQGVPSEAVQLLSQLKQVAEIQKKLEKENQALQEKLRSGQTQAEEGTPKVKGASKRSSKARASESVPADGEIPREEGEKDTLVALLKKNLGNREATAKELKINRRTLFAKMEKYDLLEVNFLPNKEEIVKLLEQCGGKRNEAAKKLGMSRSTFYRHLKNLGMV